MLDLRWGSQPFDPLAEFGADFCAASVKAGMWNRAMRAESLFAGALLQMDPQPAIHFPHQVHQRFAGAILVPFERKQHEAGLSA